MASLSMKVCKYFESKHFLPKSSLAQTFSNRAYPAACASSELLRACNKLFFFNHCSTKKAMQKVQTKCISAYTAVWPSRPNKSGRARISGNVGKIARITLRFLSFCPDFCCFVHVQTIIELFAKRHNNAQNMPYKKTKTSQNFSSPGFLPG